LTLADKPPASLFRNRSFLLLLLGQTVSVSGSTAYSVAMALWLKQATGSASLMGAVMMAAALPAAILGPIGGAAADLFPRRAVIVISDLISGTATLTVAAALFLHPEASDALIAWILIVAVLVGAQTAFMMPALRAATPDLVRPEQYQRALSLNQFSFLGTSFLGQSLGAAAFQLFGAAKIFLYNSLSYFAAAGCSRLAVIPQEPPTRRLRPRSVVRDFLREIAAGMSYVRGAPGLPALFGMVAVVNFFLAPLALLLPFYAADALKRPPAWYGLMISAITLGALTALALFGARNFSTRTRRAVMNGALPAAALLFFALGAAPHAYAAVASCFGMGFLSGLFNVNVNDTLQRAVPSSMRGRVFGLAGSLFTAVNPLAMGLAGIVADALNRDIPLMYMACAALLLAAALAFVARGNLAALFRDETTI